MTDLLIRGGRVLTPAGWIDADVCLADHLVTSIEINGSDQPGDRPVETVEADGLLVVPGFVDLQVNGGWGVDLASDPGGLWKVGQRLAATGVTAWLPTLITTPESSWRTALAALSNRPSQWAGSEPLGWHFEGPWLNPARKGAHRPDLLRSPTFPIDSSLAPEAGVRLLTLAPEVSGGLEAIAELSKRGVIVAVGHSDANSALAETAFTRGASMGTHLYNAMSGLHHRDPGLAAALLAGESYFGLIVDGIHVAPELVNLAWRAGQERLVLVTDSMAGIGLPPGVVKLGSHEVHLDGASARLADGTLAGSVLDMPSAIRNTMKFTGCSLDEAIQAASRTPAKVLSDRSRGRLVPGARADLVILDADVRVMATVVDGKSVFMHPELNQQRPELNQQRNETQ